jgi:Fur family transcriptional regulator, stress-responsive regulator
VNGDSLELLRDAGVRVTPQRRAILDAILGAGAAHPSADEILREARRRLPELSRGTVYNTLAEFVRVGFLQTVETGGAVRYDRNLDEDHQHFRCRSCGRLFDVEVVGQESLDPRLTPGFAVERTRIVLEGRCPDCRPSDHERKE